MFVPKSKNICHHHRTIIDSQVVERIIGPLRSIEEASRLSLRWTLEAGFCTIDPWHMQTWPNFAQKSETRHFETSVDAAFMPNARFKTASQSVQCNVMTVYKQYGWLSISALSFENCIFLQIQVKKDRSMIAMYAKLTKCRPRMYYIGLQWIMSRFSFSSEHLEEFRHCNCFF